MCYSIVGKWLQGYRRQEKYRGNIDMNYIWGEGGIMLGSVGFALIAELLGNSYVHIGKPYWGGGGCT